MPNTKQNTTLARCVVTIGTLMACLGIWTSVVNYSNTSQSVVTAPLISAAVPDINPILSDASISGIQPVQTGQGSPEPATANQTTAVQPTPAVTAPQALTPAQPTPTTTVPPVVTPVKPTPAQTTTPRLITRGS